MSTPLVTDEQIENETKKVVKIKKTLKEVVKEDEFEPAEDNFIKSDIVKETDEEIEKDIPSNYIEVNLVSNGRIEGIPSKLHFRCYSASDAIDLNVSDDEKIKAICKVLKRTCFENFDISLLPVPDVLYILYKLHGAFISTKITKKVYINDKIEDENLLNSDDNLEEVDIPINSIIYAYLGKDYDDNDLPRKIKIPFTIKDSATGDKVQFRFVILKDMIRAETYCRKYYKNEFIKYADIRNAIAKINQIKDEKKQDEMLDEYLNQNEEIASEYYDFMKEYTRMLAKVIQCESIVSYNGKVLDSIEEKWDVYENKVSNFIWEIYNKTLEEFPFGIKEEMDVFIPSLKTKVRRRVGFQLDDFIHVNKSESTDRYVVEFD